MNEFDLPKRTESHILEEVSRKALKSILPSEWVTNDLLCDYGEDIYVEIYRENKPVGYEFVIQLKAKQNINKDQELTVTISTKTINYLLQKPMPSMIVGFDNNSKKLYYIWLKEYLLSHKYIPFKSKKKKSIVINFSSSTILNKESISKIIDYFDNCGVTSDQLKQLLESFHSANALERYAILQKLRFVKDFGGQLILLDLMPLDLCLWEFRPYKEFEKNFKTIIDVLFVKPTLVNIMFFWGIIIDVISKKDKRLFKLSKNILKRIIPIILEMNIEEIALLTYKLFGYSAEKRIVLFNKYLRNERIKIFIDSLCYELNILKRNQAVIPKASNLFSSLYTVEIRNKKIIYLNDDEVRMLWESYNKSIENDDKKPTKSNDILDKRKIGFGIIEALKDVYGYYFVSIETINIESDSEFMESLVKEKVELFYEHLIHREYMLSKEYNISSEKIEKRGNMDALLTWYKMYWFINVLDWFEVDSFTRNFFYNVKCKVMQ